MARNDITLKNELDPSATKPFIVAAGVAGSVKRGEPTKGADAAAASPWTGAAAIMVDGDGTTSQRFTGVAKADSTDTVAAAGQVINWLPLPGLTYTAKVKLTTDMDTQAEVDAHRGKRVVFDLTSSTWTVDSAAADAVVNNVIIIDGNFRDNTVDFVYKYTGTWLSFSISA